MATYSVREFKARASEILRGLSDGEEVIITRRGKPCGRLTPVQPPAEVKLSLGTLRGTATYLPEASYEDFLSVKTLWEPRVPSSAEHERGHGRMLCTLYYQENPDTPDMEAEVRQFAEGNAGNPERFDQPG